MVLVVTIRSDRMAGALIATGAIALLLALALAAPALRYVIRRRGERVRAQMWDGFADTHKELDEELQRHWDLFN
jgi:hypothetical protein